MSEHIERAATLRRGQSWSEADEDQLRSLIEESGSLTYTSHRMGRTTCSVATCMSNLGLRTAAMRRRQPWSERDDATLRSAVAVHTQGEVTKIKHVAAAVGRSVDATISRLTGRHGFGPEMLDCLVFDDLDEPAPTASGDKRAMRRCLGLGCGRKFLSQGVENRICAGCKASSIWSS